MLIFLFSLFSYQEINLKNMLDLVPVVFITDKNYIIATATAIQSLIDKKNEDTKYEVNIITNKVNKKDIELFKKLSSENVTINIIEYNGEDVDKYDKYGNVKYITGTDLLKFNIIDIFPNYDKVLYLDDDILINGDLSELFGTDLKNTYAGVVRGIDAELDISWRKSHENDNLNVEKYFNAGVMLLNLKKMRENNITTSKLYEIEIENKKDFINTDQDVFNYIFKENITWLPPKYNTMSYIIRDGLFKVQLINDLYYQNYKSLEELKNDAIIFHFAGGKKPWLHKNSFMRKEWLSYFEKTPFADYEIGDRVVYTCKKEKHGIIKLYKCNDGEGHRTYQIGVEVKIYNGLNVPYTLCAIALYIYLIRKLFIFLKNKINKKFNSKKAS